MRIFINVKKMGSTLFLTKSRILLQENYGRAKELIER